MLFKLSPAIDNSILILAPIKRCCIEHSGYNFANCNTSYATITSCAKYFTLVLNVQYFYATNDSNNNNYYVGSERKMIQFCSLISSSHSLY